MVTQSLSAHRDIRRLKRGQRGAAREDDGAEKQQRRRIALRPEAEEGIAPGPQRGSARGGGDRRDEAEVRSREAAEGPFKYDVHNLSCSHPCSLCEGWLDFCSKVAIILQENSGKSGMQKWDATAGRKFSQPGSEPYQSFAWTSYLVHPQGGSPPRRSPSRRWGITAR